MVEKIKRIDEHIRILEASRDGILILMDDYKIKIKRNKENLKSAKYIVKQQNKRIKKMKKKLINLTEEMESK
jgi:hypothetical protein